MMFHVIAACIGGVLCKGCVQLLLVSKPGNDTHSCDKPAVIASCRLVNVCAKLD